MQVSPFLNTVNCLCIHKYHEILICLHCQRCFPNPCLYLINHHHNNATRKWLPLQYMYTSAINALAISNDRQILASGGVSYSTVS